MSKIVLLPPQYTGLHLDLRSSFGRKKKGHPSDAASDAASVAKGGLREKKKGSKMSHFLLEYFSAVEGSNTDGTNADGNNTDSNSADGNSADHTNPCKPKSGKSTRKSTKQKSTKMQSKAADASSSSGSSILRHKISEMIQNGS
jgi:hypothetical protein